MGSVAQLWRHPIKSHGREALEAVTLSVGQCMPLDRHWAVTHEASRFDGTGWVSCQNFMIGARTPGLAGLWARVDEEARRVTLTHRDLGELTFAPDDPAEAARFLDWIAPLCPENRARPSAVVSVQGRGMTDSDFPSISVMNLSSHRAVAQKLGRDIEPERWRGNIWLDGLGPWEEFEWIGKTIRIGSASLHVRKRITRCLHTAANPITGKRDAATLDALEVGWGHCDFGVYCEVIDGGDIRLGDKSEIL